MVVFSVYSRRKAMPHISTPPKQALTASATARFRLLNTDFMLMCEMDSNITTVSYQENSSESRTDECELLRLPEEPHFPTRSKINLKIFVAIQLNFPHWKKMLQKL